VKKIKLIGQVCAYSVRALAEGAVAVSSREWTPILRTASVAPALMCNHHFRTESELPKSPQIQTLGHNLIMLRIHPEHILVSSLFSLSSHPLSPNINS